MMKKMLLSFALVLTLLVSISAASIAETLTTSLQGLITEISDSYFLMQDETTGEVRVNLDDTTVYDGIAAKDTLAVGQYVFVTYNGIMTRSLPPQVSAIKIGCYVVNGTVTEITENGYMVEGDAVIGTVIVHAGENAPLVFKGVPITIYFNGIMALSMPPQINAFHTIVPVLEGTLSDIEETGFTLTDADGVAHKVAVADGAETTVTLEAGIDVRVYFDGQFANDTDVTALRVDGLTVAAPAEEAPAQE